MTNEIFDHYISNTFGSEKQCPVKRAQFLHNYSPFFPQNKDAECLDIGPGRGEMLTVLKSIGYAHSYGIDISSEIVNFCQRHNLNCEYVPDTQQYLRSHPSQFDLITLLDVLEHIDKKETISFLKAIYLSLKSGGELVIQVPNMAAEDASLYFFDDFTHVAGFTSLSLRQVLLAAGFSQISVRPMEMFCYGGIKEALAKVVRPCFHTLTKFRRKIIGAHSPDIVTPVFFAVAVKK